jgi:hypothetical protein
MMSTMMRRICCIDRHLASGDFPSTTSLAKECDSSTATISRDINHMRKALSAPIEYDASRRGYYYAEKNYRLPAGSSALDAMSDNAVQYSGVGKKQKICIEFCDDSITWAEGQTWAPDQQVIKTGKTAVIEFTGRRLTEVLDMVLSRGASGRPLAPPELVNLWKKNVTAMSIIAKLGKFY